MRQVTLAMERDLAAHGVVGVIGVNGFMGDLFDRLCARRDGGGGGSCAGFPAAVEARGSDCAGVGAGAKSSGTAFNVAHEWAVARCSFADDQ